MISTSIAPAEKDIDDTLLTRVRIVLVGTQHPGNIGAAARAMKTMGLQRLVLVAPERFPHADAEAMAAGADDLLAAAEIHDSLSAAVADCRLVLGCSARSRRIALEELQPRPAVARCAQVAREGGEVAVVFGPERTGLDNDDLQLCHAAVNIPANPEYSSLNLAAAVQILAYELRQNSGLQAGFAPTSSVETAGHPPPMAGHQVEPPATHAELEGFFTQLADTLDAIDVHKGRTPHAAMRKLRRIFLRAQLDARDVRLLRGVLADAQRMAAIATAQQSKTVGHAEVFHDGSAGPPLPRPGLGDEA